LGWRESASSPRKAVPLERRRERAVAGSTARGVPCQTQGPHAPPVARVTGRRRGVTRPRAR
jgi:hypothetical protein